VVCPLRLFVHLSSVAPTKMMCPPTIAPQIKCSSTYVRGDCNAVIHQVAQAGFPEEPPKNEQAMLIHAEFSDSAGPEKAPFSVFPLL
jgi:hypothetical protein